LADRSDAVNEVCQEIGTAGADAIAITGDQTIPLSQCRVVFRPVRDPIAGLRNMMTALGVPPPLSSEARRTRKYLHGSINVRHLRCLANNRRSLLQLRIILDYCNSSTRENDAGSAHCANGSGLAEHDLMPNEIMFSFGWRLVLWSQKTIFRSRNSSAVAGRVGA
jgi:hypothetical protein